MSKDNKIILTCETQEKLKSNKWISLLIMLNTQKLTDNYFETQQSVIEDLSMLIDQCAREDPYYTCQCIIYSKCQGTGMRAINNLAAAMISPYISGTEYSKRFYGPRNIYTHTGGIVTRPDDMYSIMKCFSYLTQGTKLSNAMKKGFKAAIESYNSMQLIEHRTSLIDIINLVHPRSERKVFIEDNGVGEVYAIDAIMRGLIPDDNWKYKTDDYRVYTPIYNPNHSTLDKIKKVTI